mmetsp:Transcript_1318/g.2842  ORF Transcript_1318/g.2842 Transcript_1318/m.2842 type:complete len:528 (-) Transcript_1318:9-1592(-)
MLHPSTSYRRPHQFFFFCAATALLDLLKAAPSCSASQPFTRQQQQQPFQPLSTLPNSCRPHYHRHYSFPPQDPIPAAASILFLLLPYLCFSFLYFFLNSPFTHTFLPATPNLLLLSRSCLQPAAHFPSQNPTTFRSSFSCCFTASNSTHPICLVASLSRRLARRLVFVALSPLPPLAVVPALALSFALSAPVVVVVGAALSPLSAVVPVVPLAAPFACRVVDGRDGLLPRLVPFPPPAARGPVGRHGGSSGSGPLGVVLGEFELHKTGGRQGLVGAAAKVHPELEDQVAQGFPVGGPAARGGPALEHVPVALVERKHHARLHFGGRERDLGRHRHGVRVEQRGGLLRSRVAVGADQGQHAHHLRLQPRHHFALVLELLGGGGHLGRGPRVGLLLLLLLRPRGLRGARRQAALLLLQEGGRLGLGVGGGRLRAEAPDSAHVGRLVLAPRVPLDLRSNTLCHCYLLGGKLAFVERRCVHIFVDPPSTVVFCSWKLGVVVTIVLLIGFVPVTTEIIVHCNRKLLCFEACF